MFKNFRNDRCYIIAEIGGNFTNFKQAKRLIDEASKCGVDAIKLQTYQADTIVTKNAKFNLDNIDNISQHDYFREFQIDKILHFRIFEYINKKNIDWFSTPSHPLDVDLLENLAVGAYKIGADDATNLPLLKYVAKTGKTILLSTGMCTLNEIKEAVNSIIQSGNENIILFHTISNYPTYPDQVNLLAMQTIMKEFPNLEVGFSDHTIGTTASICAVAMGARLIEKHFTYDKSAHGPDHMLSATPDEMTFIVNSIREFELMKGSPIKQPIGKEIQNRHINRKSIVSVKNISKGEKITEEHIDIKRPGGGIEPKNINKIIGKTVNRNIMVDQTLLWSDFK